MPSAPLATACSAKGRTGSFYFTPRICNDLAAARASLEAFRRFRADATWIGFRYFLEVFAPNAEAGNAPKELHRLADRMEKEASTLAQIESLDVGKVIAATEWFDILFGIECVRYFADMATRIRVRSPMKLELRRRGRFQMGAWE